MSSFLQFKAGCFISFPWVGCTRRDSRDYTSVRTSLFVWMQLCESCCQARHMQGNLAQSGLSGLRRSLAVRETSEKGFQFSIGTHSIGWCLLPVLFAPKLDANGNKHITTKGIQAQTFLGGLGTHGETNRWKIWLSFIFQGYGLGVRLNLYGLGRNTGTVLGHAFFSPCLVPQSRQISKPHTNPTKTR